MMTKEKRLEKQLIALSGKLLRYIRRFIHGPDAEDVLQEVYMKLWGSKNTLSKIENLDAYSFRMARNICLNQIRRTNFVREHGPDIPFQAKDTENTVYFNETERIIADVFAMLPPQQAEVMHLKSFDGLENKEIAEVTGLNTEHIRVVVSRARKKIREELEKIHSHEVI
ncbi:RNA polymerase sigma factor [Fulvitalea axinellae]